ncbi:MAG: PilZ domain-containing protein [Spirochaetales bacterium]|nr:PilZ domain-containing protein [Spirochaetales bacterium]
MEKRKYKRKIIPINVEFDLSKQQVWLESKTKDIGGGGICLILSEKIPLKSQLELKFNLPDLSSSILALGKVVWTEEVPSKKNPVYYTGIQFIRIPEEARGYIMKYVEGATFERR